MHIVPSDRIVVEFAGRSYGVDCEGLPAEESFAQEVPQILRELAPKLRQQSRLLAMEPMPELTKSAIFESYGKDLALLKRYLDEFVSCVQQAVRCSIINRGRDAEKTWTLLKGQIPSVAKAPLLELPYTRATKPAPVLLAEMKEEFEKGIERVLRLMAFWLQLLTEEEFVGLVEWSSSEFDVCRYHYFRHEHTEEALGEKHRTKEKFDDSKPYGEKREVQTTKDNEVRHRQFAERHVHHIVDAKLHRLDEYQKPAPRRIQEFLDTVPIWLRPLLHIIEGQITMEEVLRRQVAENIQIESEVISVFKYSPGVLLGHFNLIGWNADDFDVDEAERFASRIQSKLITRLNGLKRHQRFLAIGLGTILVATLILVLTFGRMDRFLPVKAYRNYVSQFAPQAVLENKAGEYLDLGVGKGIRYGGVNEFTIHEGDQSIRPILPEVASKCRPGDCIILVGRTDGFGGGSHKTVALSLTRHANQLYGNIDLSGSFQVYVTIHVLSATKDSVRYVVKRY